MMIDFRGYGNSIGKPTAHKTKLDMETAYQYLAKEHGVTNEDLLLYADALRAAPAVDLAARRKGVNIAVDENFVKVENILSEKLPLLEKIKFVIIPIIRIMLAWIVDYNNSKNL